MKAIVPILVAASVIFSAATAFATSALAGQALSVVPIEVPSPSPGPTDPEGPLH
jgi:hypothetical protein